MDSEQIARIITAVVKDVGFPIFVALYLLLKIGPALEKLTTAITDLREVTQVAAGLTRRGPDPKPTERRV